ncbi:hypothetical protein LQW54_008210 [Pestalotiopsis sp. IQ-011]
MALTCILAKCNAQRPQCNHCKKLGRECVYSPDPKSDREAMAAEIRELKEQLAQRSASRQSVRQSAVASSSSSSPPSTQGNFMTDPFGLPNAQFFIQSHVAEIKEAFTYFNNSTDFLFYSYSAADALAVLDQIADVESRPNKSVLCQACAMVAVGACFSRGKISAELGDYSYSIAKLFMDDCIENDPGNAIKVCALLTARNIVVKATVALAYIELGLGLCRNMHLYDKKFVPLISAEEWSERKRVWRSLLTLQLWLQTTLGWVPHESAPELTWKDFELRVPKGVEDIEFFQQSMARMTILKHKLLQVLPASENVPVSHYHDLHRSLHEWYEDLPAEAQISNLSHAPIQSVTRFKLYYLHLNHLGTRLLIFRCLLRRHERLRQQGNTSSEFHAVLMNWAADGITAARQSARLSWLMFTEGAAVRHCWLCIFQAYVACCIILHFCFQKILRHRTTDPELAQDLQIAKNMIEILSYCRELDVVAGGLHSVVTDYLKIVHEALDQRHLFEPIEAPEGGTSDMREGLNLALGTTKYHVAAAELFRIVAWPFGDERIPNYSKDIQMQVTFINHEEAALGVHTEWVAELEACGSDCSPTSLAVLAQSPGDFVGSQTPHGWAPGRSREIYEETASTLEFSRF